jgi:hypothetical protein
VSYGSTTPTQHEIAGMAALSDPSTVTVVFNDAPSESKMFKTLACETDSPWKATVTTDLNSGVMEASYFELKEGDYFTYIRRAPEHYRLEGHVYTGHRKRFICLNKRINWFLQKFSLRLKYQIP